MNKSSIGQGQKKHCARRDSGCHRYAIEAKLSIEDEILKPGQMQERDKQLDKHGRHRTFKAAQVQLGQVVHTEHICFWERVEDVDLSLLTDSVRLPEFFQNILAE